MRALQEPLYELAEFDRIAKEFRKPGGSVTLTGCVESQKLHIINGLSDGFKNKIIITYSDLRAKQLYEEYRFYDRNVLFFPAKDLIFFQADIHGNQLTRERVKCFKRILSGKPVTVITTLDSFMTPQIPLDYMKENVIHIAVHDSLDEHQIAGKLVTLGYEKTYQVEEPGQFSIRGGILDVYDLTEENPYRIELWGDEVDSIRSFDVLSQRSVEKLQSIDIYPASEMILDEERLQRGLTLLEEDATGCSEELRKAFKTEEAYRVKSQVKALKEQLLEFGVSISSLNMDSYVHYFFEETDSLLAYFVPEGTGIFLDEPSRVEEQVNAVMAEFTDSMMHRLEKGYILPGQADILIPYEAICEKLSKYSVAGICMMDLKNTLHKSEHRLDIHCRSMASYKGDFVGLVKDLQKLKKNGYRVLLLSGSRTRAKRLAKDLAEEYELSSFYSENPDREIQPGEIMTYYGHVEKGFEYPLIKFAVITETDIFGNEQKKQKRKQKGSGKTIEDFKDLKVGDYVVHETHGLGIYQGIEKIEVDKVEKDYMKISYRDGGNLYVLATSLDMIQKYASADAEKVPKINKLGTSEWTKTKTKVRTAVDGVAKELVELYAVRQQKQGYQYGPDTVWQKEFEEMFPYTETGDQLSAIEATKQDMESSRIMDRLVCGDVGYGKTEIAIRAAFKAVQEGKQVVYLVPTTILAQQHYNTFVQRMKDFPVRIDLLSRFRSTAQQKKTIDDLSKGFVDIVIGTHRVLSKDVAFKDLGLLIVDEEQRFGVTHKEKIKQLKEDVDVLTLTATPIPRTLHMSLVGIRDMSVLDEAPEERVPIQTFVCEYNEEMVREAISRELARGGQVYYVFNRVNGIAEMAATISELVPGANVAYAHGQMQERELERIMYDFVDGTIDVLVSTTIVETGMDIPNVNTMIIHDSDRLGLSQLYQLRGRVGRSNRTAYAFLMYRRDKLLTEVAEKRLAAIREFTDLGSGYRIALRDLEIRGAGNLLGKKQHGHMAAVGYELYCKMLNDAVRKLKGVQVRERFETNVDLDVAAYIPPSYIMNETQKLEIYKRIAAIETDTECEEVKEELLDRFGEIPKSVDNLLRIVLIKIAANKLFITEIRGKTGSLSFRMKPDAPIHVECIPGMLKAQGGRMTFDPKGVPTFRYRYVKYGVIEEDERQLMEHTERLLKEAFATLL